MPLSWPYHFVSSSAAEVQHRREALDTRGYYAQCSVIVAIVAVRVYQNRMWTARYHDPGHRSTTTSITSTTSTTTTSTTTSSSNNGKFSGSRQHPRAWWDQPPWQGWKETRRQYLVASAWLIWLLSLSAWGTGDDYLHLTKSLGHVAISLLPFQILMSPASYPSSTAPLSLGPSILSILSSIPQQTLTPYHRLCGRVVFPPLLVGHAVLYFAFFLQSNHPEFGSLLAKRVRDFDVQCGLAGVCLIVSIALFTRTVSLKGTLKMGKCGLGLPVDWNWSSTRTTRWVFYVSHVMLVTAFCVAVWFHVGHARVYVLETLGGFMLNLGCCLLIPYVFRLKTK